MVKGILFRLDKPTGEALFAGDGVNYKSSAPAGQASEGAVGCTSPHVGLPDVSA